MAKASTTFTTKASLDLGSIGVLCLIVADEAARQHPKIRFESLIVPAKGTKAASPVVVEAKPMLDLIGLYQSQAAVNKEMAFTAVAWNQKELALTLSAKAAEMGVSASDLWHNATDKIKSFIEANEVTPTQPLRDARSYAVKQIAAAYLALAELGELNQSDMTGSLLEDGFAEAVKNAETWGRKANGEYHTTTPKSK